MREGRAESLCKGITDKNFPNLGKETNIQMQKAERLPNKMNSKRPTLSTL